MKQLTLKALFVTAVAAFSLNAQASDVYDSCLSDAAKLIEIGIKDGLSGAQAFEQSVTVDQCKAELTAIENKYADQWKFTKDGKEYVVAPYSVMSTDDRKRWADLFNAIDTKNYMGVRFLMAVYYRQ